MADDIVKANEEGEKLLKQFSQENKQGNGSEDDLINLIADKLVAKQKEIDALSRSESSIIISTLRRSLAVARDIPSKGEFGFTSQLDSIEKVEGAKTSAKMKALEDDLAAIYRAHFIATRKAGNKARVDSLRKARGLQAPADKKKPRQGIKKNKGLAALLNKRSKNFNVIGFDVAAFIDSILNAIDFRRVKKGLVNELTTGDLEPKLNTFYRMIGFPPAGKANPKVTDISQIDDTFDIVTAERKPDRFYIDRGVPVINKTDTTKRFLFPVTDQVIRVPVGNIIINPFINTIIALKINKFDEIGSINPETGSVPELAFIEDKIIENIDGLITHFPEFFLKQIQKDARYRTISDRRNNVEDKDGEGQVRANNGTFTIDSVNAKGSAEAFEMSASKLEKTRTRIEEEIDTENRILFLLPLREIGINELGSQFVGLLNHNRAFLNRLRRELKEFAETISTEQRKREHALALIEGAPPISAAKAKTLSDDRRKTLANSITAIEIMAVLSALFNTKDIDLLTIALNSGIPSSQEVAIPLIIERQKDADSFSETSDSEILEKFLDKGNLNTILTALNQRIVDTTTAFTKEFDKARSKVRDEETGKTIAEVTKEIEGAAAKTPSRTGKAQNKSSVRQTKK